MSDCVPSRKVGIAASIFRLMLLGCSSLSLFGCSALSVRSDNCCGCTPPRQAVLFGGADCEDFEGCDTHEHEHFDYQPMWPEMFSRGWLRKWKEQQNLPEGPTGLKFHPLPTRPMFQPRPGSLPLSAPWNCPTETDLASETPAASPINSSGYGVIPLRSQWSELQPSVESQRSTEVQSDKSRSKDRVQTKAEEIPTPSQN